MTLPPRMPRTVRCPECKRTYRAYVDETSYRHFVRTKFDYPLLTCGECLKAQLRSEKNGLPVAENRNPERAAD